MRQALGPGALGRPRGIRWRGRWEGGSGWGTHVNPWLIHVNVWQNPLQYCKVISLQLIKINEKTKTKKKTPHWIVKNTVLASCSLRQKLFLLCYLWLRAPWGNHTLEVLLHDHLTKRIRSRFTNSHNGFYMDTQKIPIITGWKSLTSV